MSGPDWNDRHMSGDTIHPDRLAVTPPRALAALSALVASVADNDPDALTAYRSLLTQAADLATARPPHDTAIETALSVLGTYSGWGGRARELDATVKRLRKRADDARATLRLVDDGDEHVYPDLSSALSAAGVPQCPPGMSVPAGYRVLGERPHIVREVTTQDGPSLRSVAPRLLAITSIARNEEGGAVSVTLGWPYGGRWVEVTVPRRVIADRASMASLADSGAPIDASSIGEVQRWLLAQEEACDDVLPVRRALGRFGWTSDHSAFMLGDRAVGGDLVYMAPGDGERGLASSYRKRGTLAGWRTEVWGRVKPHPAAVVVLASLAAPLLGLLDVHGWTLDIGGTKSTSKTTSTHAAASVWGDPHEIIAPWPQTWAGARNGLETHHSMPTLYDDTKHVAHKPDILRAAVYAVSQRQSQPLGSAGGGTRARRPMSTLLISTGEAPIATSCQDAGGATSRLIAMRSPGLPPGHAALADAVKEASAQHFGHAGEAVVRWLLANQDRHDDLRTTYRGALDSMMAAGAQGADARVLGYVAHLHVTALVAREALAIDVPLSIVDMVRGWAEEGSVDRDMATAALEWCAMWWAQRRHRVDAVQGGAPMIGHAFAVQGKQRIGWYRGSINEALEDGRYIPDEVLVAWRDRGWLDVTEHHGFTRKPPVTCGTSSRLVVLSDSGMEAAGLL